MTNQSDKELDKKLVTLKARLDMCQQHNGLPYCKNCGLCEEDIVALKELIEEECNKARIGELKHLKGYDSFNESYTTDPRPAKMVDIRIAELSKSRKE